MDMEIFLMMLLAVSVLTGLFTESIKTLLEEHKVNYYANTLAGCVAVGLSVLAVVGYVIFAGLALTPKIIVMLVALALLSWLSAMVGYDKVLQAISQFTKYGT